MKSHEILRNLINNLKADQFTVAQQDCLLLPECNERASLYATIRTIDSARTKMAFNGAKWAAIGLADRLIGRI